MWNDRLPNHSLEHDDTFTIPIGSVISIEVSEHIVGRIYRLDVDRAKFSKIQAVVSRYFGEHIKLGLMEVTSSGVVAGSMQLTDSNRVSLARLELQDPNTPPMLRESCRAKLMLPRPLDRPTDTE